MDKKTLSIVSYITIIGWLIAYLIYQGKPDKSSLERYHLKQSLGIGVLGVLNFVVEAILTTLISYSLGIIFTITGILIFILWIIGIINAANAEEKPLPIIGSFFVDKFDFIK
ncbi:DUF4870 domain-containing protein [Flavobacterium sp. TP390]|uniref:DUF4870 domain-containing protein n=1 Tax=Flavobacterium profundi TaxID=1774945 RepID=A0A6I4IS54_9FLAO|nr:DUF4870 domain-containing protein [Flavobacterium profundi]MVO08457.1 DUF4870 domain-containing protein [Flavobacterium profundi]